MDINFNQSAKNPKVAIDQINQANQPKKTAPIRVEKRTIEEENKPVDAFGFAKSFFGRMKEKELVTFFRELSILVEARVPLIRALKSIRSQEHSQGMSEMVADFQRRIEGGNQLSEAMEEYDRYFSPLYINVVKAGETSGRLEVVLNYLADSREKSYELRRKIIGALIYPAVIMAAFLGVFVFLMIFVMPNLSKTLMDSGTKLPWTTKIVMGISGFVTNYWFFLLFILMSFGLGIFYYLKTKEGKRQWDVIILNLPIFGNLFRYMYMNMFADNLGLLLRESVPITRSLEITADIMGNHIYADVIMDCVKEVQRGGMISLALEKSKYFPNVVPQILRVGEESGKTADTLATIANYYSKEVNNLTQNMMALIEPILILFLGVGVAIIVASVIMPIYNMAGSM